MLLIIRNSLDFQRRTISTWRLEGRAELKSKLSIDFIDYFQFSGTETERSGNQVARQAIPVGCDLARSVCRSSFRWIPRNPTRDISLGYLTPLFVSPMVCVRDWPLDELTPKTDSGNITGCRIWSVQFDRVARPPIAASLSGTRTLAGCGI